tara:strand:- start:587 stop:1432 length:846 start_codon:yes stop_codon:yes gene_type:complete
MNILVTGGSGFIGNRLLKILKYKNLYLISSKRRKNFIKLDLLKPDYNKIKNLKIDVCIHLAWSGIPNYTKKNSYLNFEASKKLFEYLLKNGCKKIISLGSCWEYKENFGKKNENTIEKPENIFGHYKNKLAVYGLRQARKFEATFTWFRVFYVYGDKKKGLLNQLNLSFKKNTKILLKNPHKYNDFIFVDELVKCIKKSIKKNQNGIFNLGSGTKTTTLKFCKEYCKIKKININKIIEYNSYKKQKKSGIWACMRKTKYKFNFYSNLSLKSGINKTLNYIF